MEQNRKPKNKSVDKVLSRDLSQDSISEEDMYFFLSVI